MIHKKLRESIIPKEFLHSLPVRVLFYILVFGFSLYCGVKQLEVIGAIGCVLLSSLILVLSGYFSDAFLPLLLMTVFVTRCYDSFDTFIKYWYIGVIFVIALLFHFIWYWKKPQIGASFIGLCAVTVAVTLGGVGTLSASQYFKPIAAYYVIGLGAFLLIFYVFAKPHFDQYSKNQFAVYMYIMGMFICCYLISYYKIYWDGTISTTSDILFIHDYDISISTNNLSTFLMLTMPFPLYFASKHRIHMLSTLLMYMCVILLFSRGGLIMGTIEYFILLITYAIADRKNKINMFIYIGTIIASLGAIYYFLPKILFDYSYRIDLEKYEEATDKEKIKMLLEGMISKTEARAKLIQRAIADFKRHPIFGSGLMFSGNEDVYTPKKGAMNWHHVWFAQIIGSMGITGVIAYLSQLVLRVVTVVKNYSLLNLTFAMSYVGLFLMTQVNPGEFCPLPNAFLAVIFFILIENGGKFLAGKKAQVESSYTDE